MKPANTNDPGTSAIVPPMPNDKSFLLRLASDELEAWKAAAEADGRSLASWIRWHCNAVVKPAAKPKRKVRR